MKSIRIISDGRIYGTRIMDVESGAFLSMVNRIEIEIDASSECFPVAKVHFLCPEVDVTLPAQTHPDRLPDHLQRLFRDWYVMHGPCERLDVSMACVDTERERIRKFIWEFTSLRNAYEFARNGLKRIN